MTDPSPPNVAVFDANTLAYFFLRKQEVTQNVTRIVKDQEVTVVAPELWRSELRNAFLHYIRYTGDADIPGQDLDVDAASQYLTEAEVVVSTTVEVEDADAVMRLAIDSGCSAYDCEYVHVAKNTERARAITSDKEVIEAFPDLAATPEMFARQRQR
jgi:predicted nucleic acid-binding protein